MDTEVLKEHEVMFEGVKSFWCEKCQHGISANPQTVMDKMRRRDWRIAPTEGGVCPDCQRRGEQQPGKLQRPLDAVKDKLQEAAAINAIRRKQTVKGQKGIDEMIAEATADIESRILSSIKAKYDLVPKDEAIKDETIKRGPGRPKKAE